MERRLNHRHITGQVGLGRQCIHFLRPGTAGNHFHGYRRRSLSGNAFNQWFFVERIQKTDVQRTLLQQAYVLRVWFTHRHDDIRACQQRAAIFDDARPSIDVVGIAVARCVANATLNLDGKSLFDQFARIGRNHGSAKFAWPSLLRYTDLHKAPIVDWSNVWQ